jgi:hypothetical protein
MVSATDFNIVSGADSLTGYESSPGQTKYFCKTCGSPILSKSESKPGHVRVRLGTIDSDIVERPMAHIFATSKANWEEIADDLPQYENHEPNRNAFQ